MTNVPQLIKAVAISKGVRHDIVEKDYALSYLLAAIAETNGLRENLVLKGGTALNKLYFQNYRFSEDLDFSTLQSQKRLKERGWGASRVCRDYYDLWYLLQQPDVGSDNLSLLLKQKCAVRHVNFESPADFVSDDLLNVARNEWRQQLLPFVPDAPSASELLPQVQAMIYAIWK